MRIGTWNLAGRWSDHHRELLARADCEVWLLTEVNERTELPGYEMHRSSIPMAPRRHWAGVASRLPMAIAHDPHPASARVRIGSTTFVSSVLPWRSCGSREPWVGDRHATRTENAVEGVRHSLRDVESLVWGGDWNHALTGKEYAGSQGGRLAILEALGVLGLAAPTTELPHAIDGLLSIDHVAVPTRLPATASRVSAESDGKRLSDHDAYVVEVDL